jgi:hypothetical protein
MSFGSIIQSGGGLSYPTVRPKYDLNLIRNRSIPPEYSYTRNSSGTYVGDDGLIKTAAVNEPRFEHNPETGESLGLLVEEARTNSILYSEQFDNGYWNKISTTATSNVIAAPDGTITADQIDHQSQSGGWSIIFLSALGAAGSNVFTIYLRCATGQTVANYKLSAGGTIATITVTDQWQRFSLSYTGTRDVRMGNQYPESSPARTVYAWGAQLEAGAFPTSYIPTTTSTVTRQPDQIVLNRTLNPQGAFYIESNTTTTPLVADNGSSTISPPQGTKSALFYNTSRTLSMSSSTTPVEGNFNVPQNLNRVSLGFDRLNNSNYINGHLKKFMYYGSPVTEDNLRSLTGNTRPTFRFGLEPIVTNGLVLYLDAGNPQSYPGSGTTWTDLSGNGNNGTLTNGPTYSSANGGSITFDGVNDKVIVPYNSNLNPSNVTISVWFKRTSAINYTHFAGLPASNSSWSNPYISYGIEFISTTDQPSFLLGFSNNTFLYTTATASASTAVGLWVNVVGTYDGSFSKIYVNGQLATSIAETRTLLTTSANFVLGTETQGTSSYPLNGNIAQASIYNRALSATEVSQNYNALKSRYI